MLHSTLLRSLPLAAAAAFSAASFAAAAPPDPPPGPAAAADAAPGPVVFAPAPGEDCADALQALIDAHPNRTIRIPDGVYVLSHPVATPASPKRAVSLRLDDFAVLKAAPDWAHTNAMIRLGGSHPANDNASIGSLYGLYGGYIDGSGVADGVSIESGRETRIQNTSIRNVRIGIRVFWGANGGSADCDIRDVNLVGNNRPDSIGLLVQAFDNSFTNMRIFAFCKGVKIEGGGNLFCNVHPLVSWDLIHSCYDDTVGFWDLENNNTYDRCYADAFSTGWLFGPKSKNAVLHAPMCYWYASTPGHPHTVLRCEGAFRALVTDLWAGFRDDKATNAVLLVGEPGGHGFLDGIRGLRDDSPALNNPSDVFRDYLRGSLHW